MKVQHSIERALSSRRKNMLKNKIELLQTNDENLFVKEFSKKPFRSGYSFQQQQCKSGGQKQIATGNRDNEAKQNFIL